MPSPGNLTITLQESNVDDNYWAATAFAVSNVNTASPFDVSPKTTTDSNSLTAEPIISITTTNTNDLIIGAVGIDWQNPIVTPGSGFTQVMGVTSTSGATGLSETAAPRTIWVETMNTTTVQNNLPVSCTLSSSSGPLSVAWAIIADTVKLNSGTPITLSPTSGPAGESVTVTGSGYAANSKLVATFNGSPVSFNGTTDSSGNIKSGAVFTVPAGLAAGNYTVTITDSSFNSASATFTVVASNITVSPTSGQFGSQVTLTGTNYISNANVNVTFDGNLVSTNPSTITANSSGGFSATFNVPLDTTGIKSVAATDSVNTAYTNFTVTPSITLSPTSGSVGSTVTVSGYGFAGSEYVAITYNGATIVTNPTSVLTNSSGYFNASFSIPTGQTAGSKIVTVTDASANTASTTFTVTPSIST